MLPCGQAAHICEANRNLQPVFPAAIACLKLSNSNKVVSCENQGCKFRQGNGAIAACWQAKAQVWNPFLPDAGRPFSLRSVSTTGRRRLKKFFGAAVFQNAAEVWAGSPHLRSKSNFATCFPAAIACFETVQFKQVVS